jgi:poly(3-hydroxybutyrate) depolymerase
MLSGPSGGCGKTQPERGELTLGFGSKRGEYLVSLPREYDASVPLPLIFAFHGYGRTHLDMAETDSGGFRQALGEKAVLVFVRSQGVSWDFPHELEPSMELFDALYPRVLDAYCVDTARVFALGHSSGGYFANILGCRKGELLSGVILLAGAAEEQMACTAPLAALIMHGVRDVEVPISRGWSERDHYRERSGCSTETAPGGEPECAQYRDCSPGHPVIWCEHEEPTYGDTNHGWPSFANAAIARFVDALRPEAVDAQHNLLGNSTFDSADAAPWQRFFVAPASGSVVERAGAACVTIDEPGVNPWDIQIAHRGLLLRRRHHYVLDFRAWSSERTVIRPKLGKEVAPYNEYWANRFAVGPAPRRFRAELVMGDPDDEQGELAFHVGGGYVKQRPVTVCVDDVYFSAP